MARQLWLLVGENREIRGVHHHRLNMVEVLNSYFCCWTSRATWRLTHRGPDVAVGRMLCTTAVCDLLLDGSQCCTL